MPEGEPSDRGLAAVTTSTGADVLLVATPTYRASYTGLLKLFLDNLAGGALSGRVAVPLTVAAAPSHRSLADRWAAAHAPVVAATLAALRAGSAANR